MGGALSGAGSGKIHRECLRIMEPLPVEQKEI